MEKQLLQLLEEFPEAKKIAEGGQKSVYSIEHPRYGPCVLKVGKCQSAVRLERIRREFAVLNELDSHFFPKVYDLTVLSSALFVIIEQRLPADPLSKYITDFSNPCEAVPLVLQIIDGLRLLWDRNIIHRDIKPDNILISKNRDIYIVDLGIARLQDESSLTPTLLVRGPCTPVYAAPEQLENRKHQIDHRCDQFAVGILLGQLLLKGAHPFAPDIVGDGDSIVDNLLAGRWAEREFQRRELAPVYPLLRKMLGREPYQRFRRHEDLLCALRTILEVGA